MQVLEDPRQVASDWHVLQAKRLLAFDRSRHLDTVLVYAALELRMAIERRFLEILLLLRGGELTEAEITRCRSRQGIEALLRETDRSYSKTFEFTRLIASIADDVPEISAIDVRALRRLWEGLSEYCHLQFKPETLASSDRQWQKKGFSLVHHAIEKLRYESLGVIPPPSMPEETRMIYDRFARAEIDREQARRMLRLADPVLKRRRAIGRALAGGHGRPTRQ